MSPFIRMLVHGALLSVVLSAILLFSIRLNPRLWLRTYPEDVKQMVPPKSKAERRLALTYQVPFLLLMMGVPVLSAIGLKRSLGGEFTYGLGALNIWVVSFMFNLVDWLVIDWLVFCWFTPRFIVIPGTEGSAGYKDYGMHLRAFFKGTVLSLVFAVLAGYGVYTLG